MDHRIDSPSAQLADKQSQPLRLCIFGQPFWGNRLKETIEKYIGPDVYVSTLFPQSFPNVSQWQDAACADVLLRVGYRPGARTLFGRVFESFWATFRRFNPNARVAYYWIGTDVLNALKDYRSKMGPTGCFIKSKNDIHLVDAPWLVTELAEIDIQAEQIHFPSPILKSEFILPTPETFSVLTYIPDRRYRFYDGESIYEAALRLPHITFNVVAGKGSWVKAPLSNLHFLGWRNDMDKLYADTALVVRLVHHDALGCMVQEGLCFSKQVIYSYKYPHCAHVAWNDAEALIENIEKFELLHSKKQLNPNVEGWKYGIEVFDESVFAKQLIRSLSNFPKEELLNVQ